MKNNKVGSWCGVVCQIIAVYSIWLLGGENVWAQDSLPNKKYQDTKIDFVQRAEDLVSRMTLEEKASQLVNDAPAIPRLGVREYNWWNEGLHGVAGAGYATVFPQAIGMAATWNAPLMNDVADVISTEFRAKYLAEQHRFGGSDWFSGLTVWSPNINIFRDPRWGRGQETYGEDPYLTSRLAVAFIQGLQGQDNRYLKTVATPKHFAVHSGPESNRHREDVKIGLRDMEETYLPAFRAAIVEGQAASIMCAYNAVNGKPACAHDSLLKTHLREDWGFDGFVVSDCDAVRDIYREDLHNFTKTPEEGVAVAFKTGLDLICGSANESESILRAVKKGLLNELDLDRALVRLFSARMRLGQFDPRPMVFPKITPRDNDTEQHQTLALNVAEQSMVLLKNKNALLPLSKAPRKLAVIGPNADSLEALVGNYNGSPSKPVTVLDGIRMRFGQSDVVFAPGCGLLDPVQMPVADQYLCADKKCRKQGLHAAYFTDRDMADPAISTRIETNARLSWEGEAKRSAVRWTGFLRAPESGEYTFRYEADGGYRIWVGEKLVVDAWNVDWRPAIASGSITLKSGKTYPVKIESFQRGDQGNEQLVWSLPSNPGAAEALKAAESADVVVFVGGISAQVEGEEMPIGVPGFTGGDRTRLDLPPVQQALLKSVIETGKPTVLVLMNGSALSINYADSHVDAIVEAWYPGGSGGQAVANLLAGDFSPAGRLPITFYRSVNDLPPFSDYSMQNRTYRFYTGEALYPFGYGLSYTKFKYSNISVSPRRLGKIGQIVVKVDVSNVGDMDSDEVAQVYLSRNDSEKAPLRSLVGFQRFFLKKGETRKLTFAIDARELSSVDDQGNRRIMPGAVNLWVGGGQPDVREDLVPVAGVKANFQVVRGIALK